MGPTRLKRSRNSYGKSFKRNRNSRPKKNDYIHRPKSQTKGIFLTSYRKKKFIVNRFLHALLTAIRREKKKRHSRKSVRLVASIFYAFWNSGFWGSMHHRRRCCLPYRHQLSTTYSTTQTLFLAMFYYQRNIKGKKAFLLAWTTY